MLRSLYAYKGTHARTLGFQVGEKFTEIGTSRDPNWLHVISERGSIGYVPKNYMGPEEAAANDVLEFIDGCIEAIHLNASERGGTYTRGEHDALHKLVELRQQLPAQCPPTSQHSKRPAPLPPQRAASQLSTDSVSSQPTLPSPSIPTLPPSGSSSSLGPPPLPSKEGSGGQQGAPTVETTTSFIGRGDSLVRDDSSGSSEGRDTSIGYESELRSDVDSGVQTSIRNLVTQVPAGYLRSLVEEVRNKSGVSYTSSHHVVEIVLKSVGSTLPSLQPLCMHILSSKEDQSRSGDARWRESGDGVRLAGLLEQLRECKDDEQQRSWALHEDEHVITTHLTQLLDLLNNGDLEACRSVLALDDFRPLLTLVQYYQMETRWPLRKLLLQVFGAVCQMSAANISYLSASVFPVELAREMAESTCSEEQLQYISLVLGMVLCMGDTLPYTYFSVMDEIFLGQLLDGIESYHQNPDTEQLGDLYLTLVLAFNLQYPTLPPPALAPPSPHDSSLSNGTGDAVGAGGKDISENLIIKLLAQRQNTKHFTEKLLLLFNREEDPLAMFEHEPRPSHSVLKMMRDMYASHATASNFYTNDERVVCDIIIRQMTDLPADDARRGEYLHLFAGLLGAGGWKEHEHRKKDAVRCCFNILAEEHDEPAPSHDQNFVRSILDAHPAFFREQ